MARKGKRDKYGRFAPKAGAIKPYKSKLLAGRRGGSGKAKLGTRTASLPLRQIKVQGKGYNKVPNRREVRQAIAKTAILGASGGFVLAGPAGVVPGAVGATALTGASIARRTRVTKKRIARTGR